MKQYFVYLLRCKDNTLYCGKTNNLEKRLGEHNWGKRGAKYTRGRRPVTLVYFEKFRIQKKALQREWEIKKYSKEMKEEMINSSKSS